MRSPSRLDSHHHKSEPISSSLQAFRSKISNSLDQILLYPEPGPEFLSLTWVQQCFKLLPLINKAFAKLMVDIDYPVSKWEAAGVEDYLSYSLNMLDLLNSVSLCLSHLSHDRLLLQHALSAVENSPSSAVKSLRKIQPKDAGKQLKMEGMKQSEERLCSEKNWAIHQALLVMKSISLWVFGISLSGLCSDVKPYTEMRKLAGRFDDSLLKSIDFKVGKEIMEKKGELKEVRDVNCAADSLVEALGRKNVDIAAEELRRRLEALEKLLQGVKKETGDQFSEILAARNKILDSFRLSSRSIID